MTDLPKSRHSEVVVQALDKELLIYDLKTNQAYHLNETAMIVFEACANGQTFEDLQRKHNFTGDLIWLTLDILARQNLLAESFESKLASVSRREAIRKVGLATMVALPVISALVAPKPAQAASTCTGGNCVCDYSGTAIPPGVSVDGMNCATSPYLVVVTPCANPACNCYAVLGSLNDRCAP